LALAIFGGVDAEILGRVIALAVANARAGYSHDFYVYGAPAAVVRCIRAVVAQKIVSVGIGLHGTAGLAKISQVETAAPPRIGGERGQSFARILPRPALLEDGGAAVHGISARSSHAGIAARNFCQQPA